MIPGDRVLEMTSENRHNINVVHLTKDDSGKGEVKRETSKSHKSDFEVL